MSTFNPVVWGMVVEDGGPGSGNFGHAGRPGKVGGSAPSGGSKHAQKTPPDDAYPAQPSYHGELSKSFSKPPTGKNAAGVKASISGAFRKGENFQHDFSIGTNRYSILGINGTPDEHGGTPYYVETWQYGKEGEDPVRLGRTRHFRMDWAGQDSDELANYMMSKLPKELWEGKGKYTPQDLIKDPWFPYGDDEDVWD